MGMDAWGLHEEEAGGRLVNTAGSASDGATRQQVRATHHEDRIPCYDYDFSYWGRHAGVAALSRQLPSSHHRYPLTTAECGAMHAKPVT